jgi:hypothetical protein
MHRKFASIAYSDKYGYAFESGASDSRAEVCDYFRMFETGGDGLTQHSPDWGVNKEYFADYLASLAVALKGKPISTVGGFAVLETADPESETVQWLPDGELIDYVRHEFERRPTDKEILFASSVVYKEGKRRWYSIREQSISSSESKRHDKRYEEVCSEHDGSAKSIYRLLVGQWPDALRAYNVAAAIYDWCRADNDRPYILTPARFLEWTDNYEVADTLHTAYEACRNLCEGYRLLCSGSRGIQNYARHVERQKAKGTNAA